MKNIDKLKKQRELRNSGKETISYTMIKTSAGWGVIRITANVVDKTCEFEKVSREESKGVAMSRLRDLTNRQLLAFYD